MRKNGGERDASRWRLRRLLWNEPLEQRIVLTNYIVDTLNDTVANDGLLSLREAVIAANSNAPFADAPAGDSGPGNVDTIRFAASLSGQVASLTEGTLPVTDALAIFDNNSESLILDGNATQRIFDVDSSTGGLTLSNITIRNGSAVRGGAIHVGTGSLLNLSNVVLQGNRADDGGAIYNEGGTIIALNSTFTSNAADAENGSGGAIFSADGSVSIVSSALSFNRANRAGGGIEIVDGTLTMLQASLIENDVAGSVGTPNPGNGGGVHVSGTASVTIANGVVVGNTAGSEGGGLWNQAGASMEIHNTIISDNTAEGSSADNGGGGIFNNGGTVTITGSETQISHNSASGVSGSGGGIFNDASGSLSIRDATIAGNVANRAGGGIEATAGTTTTLTNVQLTENNAGVSPDAVAAPGNGGGVHVTGAGDVTITGGTVTGNVAAREGGGLWNGAGTMTIDGTLIDGNLASGSAGDDGGGGIFNNGGPLNIRGATIGDNIADGTLGSGGGLLSLAGAVTVSETTFSFNSANRAGGGIEIVDGSLTLTNVNLLSNDVNGGAGTPSPGNGGGLHVTGNGTTVTLDGGSVFNNEAASEGGGLWNQSGSTLIVQNGVLVDSNEAFGSSADNGGGGIFNNGGTVTITGSETQISHNFATGVSGSGGGIFNDASGSLSIRDATIAGNVANRAGGGIEATAGTTTTLINVQLTENNAGVSPDGVAAPGNGGGVHVTGAGDVTITGGTVTGNVAAREGGGLWNGAGTMTIDGTLIDGNLASGSAGDDGGGGIFNNGGPLNIRGATIGDNIADGTLGSGGGLLSLAGAVTVSETTFSFNSANRAGGGIEIVDGSLTLTNVNLLSNDVNGGAGTPSPGNGGGLHVTGNGTTVTLDGGSVFNNVAASEGGGLWNQAGSTLIVQNGVLVDSNEAFGSSADNGGGGIFNNGGTVTITGSETQISHNFASGVSGSGGGIFNDASGSLSIRDATIAGNVANRAGGGIEATAGTTTTLTNVQLTENNAGVSPDAVAAPGNGGGVHVTGAGDVTITGGTVTGNVAAREGGGLWNGAGTMTIDGTLIDGNLASGSAGDDGGGGIFNNAAEYPWRDDRRPMGRWVLAIESGRCSDGERNHIFVQQRQPAGGGIEIVDGSR